MSPTRALAGTAIVIGAVVSIAVSRPAAQAPAPGAAQAGGRGGRGNPTAMLYTERCSGCHGTDLSGGRAPTLFDEKWLAGVNDDRLVKSIHEGVTGTEMPPFKDTLSDEQIWQLIQYIRTQSGNLKTKPVYVADPAGQVIKSEKQTFTIDVVARNLETPWGIAFLPDGRLLVTERPGRLRVVDKTGKVSEPVKGTPTVYEMQDGGMFDVEVHPHYAQNGWIYLSYSEVRPGYVPTPTPEASAAPQPGRGRGAPSPPSMTVIIRGRINARNEWTDQQFIFRAEPELYASSNIHFGSRFTFDKQGHLFYTLGERGTMQDAQDLTKPTGKIHRVNDDGSVPKDNPFLHTPGAVPTIWSYGHRNPEGLAWDPVTGALWESEHGPTGGDEINVIQPGHNYGWGVASKGSQPGITKTSASGMDDPIVYYTPAIAPSGIVFYSGNKYPGWKNNLFVAALAGQQLRRLETRGNTVTHQEVVFGQFGRVHDVIQGPDGELYATLQLPGPSLSSSTPGMVIRLVPSK